MEQGKRMRAIGPQVAHEAQDEAPQAEPAAETVEAQPWVEEEDAFDDAGAIKPQRAWVWPTIAAILTIGWTAFYGWAMQGQILNPSSTPQQWSKLIVDWSIPVLLIGVAWLIILRNSRREAMRFAETAAHLSHESEKLEDRLGAVNRELSLAREFLASQSLELESLGRVASERLSRSAEELQQLIQVNGEQVESIGTTSDAALANMRRLRDDLPVISTAARDTASQIGNTGHVAQEQVEALGAGLEKLNAIGSENESRVENIGGRIEAMLEAFEARLSQIEELSSSRFRELEERSDAYRADLSSREVEALAAMRQRAETLQGELKALHSSFAEQEGQTVEAMKARFHSMVEAAGSLGNELRSVETAALTALMGSKDRLSQEIKLVSQSIEQLDQNAKAAANDRLEMLQGRAMQFQDLLDAHDAKFTSDMERRQSELEAREAKATEALAQRLEALDSVIANRRDEQIAETQKLLNHSRDIGDKMEQLTGLLTSISELGSKTANSVSAGIADLSGKLSGSRSELAEAESELNRLTESGVRLLEIIQSSARHSREDLAAAIQSNQSTLEQLEDRAKGISATVDEASGHGGILNEQIAEAQTQIGATDAMISSLQSRLALQSDEAMARLQGLRGGIAKLTEETETLSGDTQNKMREAIAALEEATKSAFEAIEHGTRERIGALSENMSKEAVDVLHRALRNDSAEAIGRIEQAAAHASGVGREATIQLRDQLSMVNELTGNLEHRIARARELAEEQIDNDYSRRMAQITDSLNSNAIDITTALQTDVSDTAWDAYLKGDRGIFTRRAVRLIDNGQAREIAEMFQRDEVFRRNVSRYIHDFEAMLRSMLSTRNGNALSVTMLGSDMGKLYVILAQSIERFRS